MKKDYFLFPKAVCYTLFAASLALDIMEIATGSVDLNRHLPFLFPALLAAYALIIIRVERLKSARDRDPSSAFTGRRPTDRDSIR